MLTNYINPHKPSASIALTSTDYKTGTLLLSGSYKFETKDYKLDISGKGLRLEDFQEEFLEGPLSLKGNLYGRVLSEGFKKGLSGNFKINYQRYEIHS